MPRTGETNGTAWTRRHGHSRCRRIRADPRPALVMVSGGGGIACVLFAIEEVADGNKDLFRPGALADVLPPGIYIRDALTIRGWPHSPSHSACTGSRDIAAGGKGSAPGVPGDVDGEGHGRIVEGVFWRATSPIRPQTTWAHRSWSSGACAGRPPRRCGAHDLRRGSHCGDFRLIRAVGHTAARAPRLIDLTSASRRIPGSR